MYVRDGMSRVVLVVGPNHTLREPRQADGGAPGRRRRRARPRDPGPGIITERDIAMSVGSGEDPETELVSAHMATDIVYAAPTGRWRRRP